MTTNVDNLKRKRGFTFKQFFVAHDRCGMKVSTDGVVLGAWVPLPDQGRILDIGSGSGLLSLMLAQRSAEHPVRLSIDAVEIDHDAWQQSCDNVAASPWPHRITCFHADILNWQPISSDGYPLIVCNPPYYQSGPECQQKKRTLARHSQHLQHQALLDKVAQLLAVNGLFCVILPMIPAQQLTIMASAAGWYLREQCELAEYEGRPAHRRLLAWSREPGPCQQQRLVIRHSDGRYSKAFRELTHRFYLTMASG